ncbi:putative defense protein Hdd11-like isoform X2 [Anguilla anguilla]|uniref:putative defense protein Hdd11-like isoform X2 n=1 Tax=Anguilla anguilla TaxID=7936 RepID=UPI0015B25559|nr:putative defense protein Hdd11-like isoform X2 [Anguilla anguilla]
MNMTVRMGTLLLNVLLVQVLSLTVGYPTGAPSSACEDMMPRHGVQPQPSPAPYSIQTSNRTFQPGQPVTVTINGPDYAGVLLEARMESTASALGTWQSLPTNTQFLHVGHLSAELLDVAHKIKFQNRATVAQQRTVFWLNVKSDTLTKGVGTGADGSPSGVNPVLWAKAGPLCMVPSLIFTFMCSR